MARAEEIDATVPLRHLLSRRTTTPPLEPPFPMALSLGEEEEEDEENEFKVDVVVGVDCARKSLTIDQKTVNRKWRRRRSHVQ